MTTVDETQVLEQLEWRPRRVKPLRWPSMAWLTVLVNLTTLVQLGGGVAVLVGVYLQWGLPPTLITGGIAAVVLASLREAEKI